MQLKRQSFSIVAFNAPAIFLAFCFGLMAGPNQIAAQAPERVPWTTSNFKGAPEPPFPFVIERVFKDLKLVKPTEMIRLPNSNRWVVVQMNGQIISFADSGEINVEPVMDMKKAGPFLRAYGIAFHPEFPQEPYCYITYSSHKKDVNGSRLSRYRVSNPKRPVIDPASEKVLVKWSSVDHCGGSPKFGADGFLYFSIGDGQRPNPPDPLGTGQDISDLQASILRIDVDGESDGLPYRIPPDNPFVDTPNARPEIWAFGVRNPWRLAFRPNSNELWVGDVGWEMMEMVYRIDRGANYGWSIKEGSHLVKLDGNRSDIPVTPPIVEYDHVEGRSITGGYFWQSDRVPELKDAYIYGDYMNGRIWGVKHDGNEVTFQKELANTPLKIITFALDNDGDVLTVGFDGTIHRLIPNPSLESDLASVDSFPRKLSDTGIFSSTENQTPSPGVMPYSINAHNWADHTTSEHWFGLPPEAKLGIHQRGNYEIGAVKGLFTFPVGTVFAKTVSYLKDESDPESAVRLETQILHKLDLEFRAYNYIWNEDQTDAFLQDKGAVISDLEIADPSALNGIRKQKWLHAGRDQCMLCHVFRSGSVIGFKTNQLHRKHADETQNQLDKFESLGLVSTKLQRPKPAVSPYDTSANLEDRARQYLDLNCSHCHQRGGGGSAPFVLSQTGSVEDMNLVGTEEMQGDFGIEDALSLSPGKPYKSVLLYRMAKLGPGRMPKFGPNLVDQQGIELIRDWISSINPITEDVGETAALMETIDTVLRTSNSNEPVSDQLKALLAKPESALALAIECGRDQGASPAVSQSVAEASIQHGAPGTPDLFERFLPEEKRTKRLSPDVQPETLVALAHEIGDFERGRKLYFESAITCRNCHQIGEQGKSVGPALDDIALKRKPLEIVESLLDPSKDIEDTYQGVIIVTVDGKIHSGLASEIDDDTMGISSSDGSVIRIPNEDIENMRGMQKSVMPEALLQELTTEQAADLLSFLFSQKKALPTAEQ